MSKVDCKVVLLGRHSVGKTCLAERYLNGEFNARSTATIGAAFRQVLQRTAKASGQQLCSASHVTVGNEDVTLGIWDTAGAERYESMSRIYYRSAKAAIICYDLTDEDSFSKVKLWVTELTENEPECVLYVVGTKVDKLTEGAKRGIEALEARNYATQHGARYHETSAATGKGVGELFQDIASQYLTQRLGAPKDVSNGQEKAVDLNNPKRRQQSGRKEKNSSGGGCCD